MARKNKEPLESHHIKLYMGDFDELDRILAGKLSPSVAIRLLVRNFIVSTREKAQQTFKPMEISANVVPDPADQSNLNPGDSEQEPT